MKKDIYQAAREAISPGLIQTLFNDHDSKIVNGEYFIRCPFRSDENVGSFSINLNKGIWKDFSTGDKGDFIDLVARTRSCDTLDAAKYIANQAGNLPIETRSKKLPEKKKNNEKFIPVYPIANEREAAQILKKQLTSDYYIEKFGPVIQNWAWKSREGKLLWAVIRHSLNGSKNDIPYFFTKEKKWRQGYPINKDRPLFGLHKYKNQKKLLIVEGQKCADIITLKDWLIITWPGGTNAVKLADWSPIRDLGFNQIVIWPDNDSSGIKAAIEIKEILHDQVIEILNITNKPKAWDLADAIKDGINIQEFIKGCPRQDYTNSEEIKNKKQNGSEVVDPSRHPFKFLGFTEKTHFILPDAAPMPYSIQRGSVSVGQLMEIAPESWWLFNFNHKSGLDKNAAADWLVRKSQEKGYFMSDTIRGAGVWRDKEKIIINTGRDVMTHDGENYTYQEFESEYIYVMSEKRFGDLSGDKSTDQDGKNLIELFYAQKFQSDLEAMALCGWSLIAPFSSFLKWRPHVWISGPKEIGKSYLIEDIIQPLVGPIAHTGSGRDTEAGIRRDVRQDGCPVILDETEPRNQESRKRIDAQLELARNASSDASSEITIASSGGGVDKFRMRQSFLFSSIIPYMDNGAIASRFILCKLNERINFEEKKRKTLEILQRGTLNDPSKYRKRIFSLLPVIDENIQFLRTFIFNKTGSQRQGDKLAPLFAAVYNIVDTGLIKDNKHQLERIESWITGFEKDVELDEDTLIRELFESHVKHDSDLMPIAELISKVEENFDDNKSKYETLQRYGIRLLKTENELAIAFQHRAIRDLLKDTFFAAKYGEVLRRHKSSKPELRAVRIAGGTSKCVIFDFDKIKNEYLKDEEKKGYNFAEQEDVPF